MPLKLTDDLEAMRTRWLSSQPPSGRQAREDVAELFRVLDEAHVDVHRQRRIASSCMKSLNSVIALAAELILPPEPDDGKNEGPEVSPEASASSNETSTDDQAAK